MNIAGDPKTSIATLSKLLDEHSGHLDEMNCCADQALRNAGEPSSIFEVVAARKTIPAEILEKLLAIDDNEIVNQLDFMIHLVRNPALTAVQLQEMLDPYTGLFPDEQLYEYFAGLYSHKKATKAFKKEVLEALEDDFDEDMWDEALSDWEF